MKIWFAADILKDSHGGIARSMRELAAGFKQRGYIVKVIDRGTLPGGNYLIFALKLCGHFLCKGFDRPDWIIARSTDAVFCAMAIRLFRLKTGIILHNHGWEEMVYSIEKKLPHSIVSNPTTWKSLLIRFPLLRLMLKLSTYCMSGTMHEMEFIGNKYPKMKNKLIYVPNGVKVQADVYWKNQKEYPYYFLSVGNVTWKKNLKHTAQVFHHIRKKCSNARLICVGTGVDDTLLSGCIGLKVEGIENVPYVNYKDMETLYTTCPFMISSSRYEGGHSLAVLEAMSFGIVVFASAIESNKDIINDGYNGYLITGSDANADAEYIIAKVTSDTPSSEIRQEAAETAKLYSWDIQVNRLEKILCKIE